MGAVLALVGGVATELWKQHQAARAAERLVWLALILARSVLLGAVALCEWPDDLPFSDDAWTAQRDRLALGWDTKAFREVLAALWVPETAHTAFDLLLRPDGSPA
jgi:hypothetical protein